MDDQKQIIDDYAWWREALAKRTEDFDWWHIEANRHPHDGPQVGYYRDGKKNRACAITKNEHGAFEIYTTDNWTPKTADQLADQFGIWCTIPISYEDFCFFDEHRRWPEDVEPYEINLPDDAPEHEKIALKIECVRTLASLWYDFIGKKVATEAHNLKAQKYVNAIGELTKQAEDTRKAVKEEYLVKGRAVDAAWKPVVDRGTELKKGIAGTTETYRLARAERADRLRKAEEERLRAEQRAIEEENRRKLAEAANAAQAEGKPVAEAVLAVETAPVPTVQLPPKAATGLRTQKEVEITSLPLLAEYLAKMNTPNVEFLAVCKTLARKMLAAGVEVPGARMAEKKVAK